MREGLGIVPPPGVGLDDAAGAGPGDRAAERRDRAYFLDLLGDSHTGLGQPAAALEAYRQAADEFKARGARCSYALCLLKIAGSHLSLAEPWHAVGYLEACLPLLRELGLVRYETIAAGQLSACRAGLAHARPGDQEVAGPRAGPG